MFETSITGQIATLTMSSPPVNALSEAWLSGFSREISGLETRSDWKVLHLRSDQKAFCAGADVKEMRARFDAADGPTVPTPMSPRSSGFMRASKRCRR